jgi:predicted glutamine amidotransferase
MIAAAGELDPRALLEATRRMAANENPAHTHERRARGARFRHEDGWGAAWSENGDLRIIRRPMSILEDREADRKLGGLTTRLLFIHARRASRGRPLLRNTHPFSLEYLGRTWAFCHNGTIDDHWVLQRVPGLVPQGGTDSEHLFHHLLNRIGAHFAGDLTAVLEPAVLEGLSMLRTYTAAHCFLATRDRIVAAAARHPERSQPGYHALWEGCGDGRRVVSSEPVDGLGCTWTRIAEPGVITLEVPS